MNFTRPHGRGGGRTTAKPRHSDKVNVVQPSSASEAPVASTAHAGTVFALELALEKSDYTEAKSVSPIAAEYFGDYQNFAPTPESDSFVSPIAMEDFQTKFKY